jgi:ATP-dependent Lon protease
MLFDEADKLSATPKGEEVQNMLVHLTDPAANGEFEDKYLAGVPINLSKAMFVFTANDITKIDRVLLDRMNVIYLKGYDAKEKLAIAENYLLPAALRDVNLHERVGISREIIQHVIERCLEQIAQKLNMLRMYNAPSLPFHIKDFTLPFTMKKEQVDLFLKKTELPIDGPPPGMYI